MNRARDSAAAPETGAAGGNVYVAGAIGAAVPLALLAIGAGVRRAAQLVRLHTVSKGFRQPAPRAAIGSEISLSPWQDEDEAETEEETGLRAAHETARELHI